MRTQIKWAELHAPLFLAGTNLLQKLDPTKRVGLLMEYDEERRHLYVSYNGHTARVPETSVLSMIEAPKVAISGRAVVGSDITATTPIQAQVSTPHSHVFEGPGAGQTGQEEPVKRGPGRPKSK